MASKASFPHLGNEKRGGDEWNLVIKVNYGDFLRRFSASVRQQLMTIEYDMNTLRAKISSLFKFSHDAVLVLTYTDEDGDVVALDNDDELHDAVVCQRLNPLRINVQLKSYLTNGSYSRPKTVGNSDNNSDLRTDKAIPARNSFTQLTTELNFAVEKSLKSVPEAIRGVLANLSHDMIQTASSAPVFSELLLPLSKMQLANVSRSSHEPIGNPVGTTCGAPSAVDPNTDDEPKVSKDPHNQLPVVLPQTNLVSPVPEDVQKMPEVGHLNQCLRSITIAPVDFDQNMTKEQKEGCEVHCDGMFVVAAEPPSISDNIQGCNNTFHVTGQCPFDSTLPFTLQNSSTTHVDVFGNGHASPTAFPCHSPMPLNFRSSSCHDRMSHTFDSGVECYVCGMHPIMGPRYKSTVKENYDICSACFQDMGSQTEYIRIDWPSFHFPKAKKVNHKRPYCSQLSSTFASHNRMNAPRSNLESCFIRDVTIWDGTVMRPSSHFTKTWRMRNNGTISWPFGTQIVWVGGYRLGCHDSTFLKISDIGFPVDEELDITVDFLTPEALGQYTSFWQLKTPSGQKFGEEVSVIIQVDDSQSASSAYGAPPASPNLYLPPERKVESKSDENTLLEELLKPMPPYMLNSTQQDGNSVLQPSSDNLASLFTGSPLSFIDVPASSPAGLNPAIDVPSGSFMEENPVEQALLRELEEMGFKQVDLNKEILRLNKYDLEQSVEDLCGFTEWVPLLQELQEMGFNDRELNRKLLSKNGGCLELVVIDLIVGEKGE